MHGRETQLNGICQIIRESSHSNSVCSKTAIGKDKMWYASCGTCHVRLVKADMI